MRIRPVKETDIYGLAPLMLDYIVKFYQRPDPGPERV